MDNSQLSVTVRLDEIVPFTTPLISPLYPDRTLLLQAPDWSVKIGRSTSSGSGPRQGADNAWYSSRVISREHAELRADPETRELLIRDRGSMHGTHVGGRRLKKGVTERLYSGDNIVFGAEVARGDDTFLPVEVSVAFTWSDGYSAQDYGNTAARNYFTADYSEDEPYDYDSEGSQGSIMEIAYEGGVNHGFSVPESDISDDIISVISDEDPISDEESPVSSPIDSIGRANKTTQNKENHGTRDVSADERLSPSLGARHNDDSDIYAGEDSYYEDSSVFEDDEEVAYIEHEMDQSEYPAEVASSQLNVPRLGRPASQPILLSPSPPPERHARDPSPSDAAMVKQASQGRSPPFGEALPRMPTPEVSTNVPSYLAQSSSSQPGRNTAAWAGHNSILYDAMPLSPFGTTYPDQVPHSSRLDNFDWSAYRPVDTSLPNFDSSHYSFDLEAPSTSMAATTALNTNLSKGKKRKADHISDDNVLVPDSNGDAPAQAAQDDDDPMPTIDLADLQPIVVTETIESIKSPEPPKKKVKKHRHDSGARKSAGGSTFAKYAATALASAAVGAAGTIWALVALPKDYFA